jgi:hypothetical protein
VIAGEGHALLHDGGDGWSTVPTPTSGYFTVAAPPVVPGSQPSSLWLLTGYGVWVSAGDGWSALPALPLPGGDRAVALSVASAQDIWVTTDSGTVLHLDGSSWANSRLPDGDVPTRVLALGPNDVWVGGQRGGDTEPHVPFTAHWDGSTWTDVSAPPLVDSAVTTLAASGGDLWATVETSIDGGSPTKTHLLHLKDGEWHDTATLEGDSYRFNVLAGGTSGIWRYAWTTPSGPPTSIEHWTGSGWERTVAVPNGWDLGGNELWQQAGLGITGAGADVVRMGDKGIVDFRYICNGP